MSIPPLDEQGLLPPRIHDCTLEEVNALFGNDRWVENKLRPCRSHLFKALAEYVQAVQRAGVGVELVLDRSFLLWHGPCCGTVS